MSNNVFSVDRDLSFGDLAGGVGSMHFAGELTVGRDEILGNAGTGRMIQGISLHTVGNNFTLARQAGSQASFVGLPGSRLHVGKDLVVGAAGNATMNFSGGLMNVGNDLIVAGAGGSSGTLHFDGPSFVDVARDFVVGDGGEGSGRKVLDLLSSIKVGRDLMLGRSAGGAGTFEMLAGNMIVTRDVVVGNGGRGLLVVGVASGLIADGNVTVGRSNVTVGLPPLSLPGLPNVQLSDLIANAASNAPSPSLGTTFGTLPDIGLSPDLEYTAFRTLSDGLRVDFPFVPANTMLVFAGASVPIRGNLVVGAEGKGVFGHFAAGAVEVGGSLIVGQQGEGVYSAGGLASLVVDGDWIVGDAGKGVWAGGGTMAVHGNAVFGRQAGSRALLNYVAGGGTSLSHDLILGDHGSATLVQAASGGFLIGGSFVAGREADGVGTWDVAADQLSIGGDLVLGGKGRGTATLRQGATIAVTGAATLGQAAGSHGTLDMTGTGLGLGGSMVVGAAGEGGLHLRSGSSLLMGGALTFGELAGAVGDGTFDAGSYLSVGGALVVGAAGNGTVSFTSAAGSSEGAPFTVKSDVLLGRDQGVTGTGTLVGLSGNAPALEITGSMTVGADGQGSFTHTGGRVGIGVDLTLGASGFGAGRYEIAVDANLRIDRDLVVGNTGHAEFVHNGGDVTVAGRVTLALHGQPATYQLLGGKLLAHDFWLNSQGAFTAGLGIASFDSASVFDGTLDLGRNSDLVLQANPVAPVHRIGYLELTGGTVRAGKLSILPDGSIHQNGGELDTLQIVFDHGTVLGELQSKRLFTVVGPTPALFGGRLRNEGLIELLTDFEAADGVDNRGTFDIAAARTVKLSGSGLANRGDMELRGRLDTNETRVTGSIRQYGGSHITGELTVEDGGGAQARYSLVDGLLQVEQFSTIGASDTPGLFVQEGGTHDVGRLLRVAGGGRYTMVGGRIVAESTLNEGLFEVTNGRIDTSFENAGSFRWNGQGDVAGTGTITHLSSGSFEASATGSFAPAVVNRGQWTKEGAGTQTYSGPITQNGSLLVNAGTMRLTGGATGEGNTSIATGAAMEFAGGASYTLSRQFNNNGQVLIDPAAATFRGSGLHTGRFDVDAGGDLTFAGISWTFNGTGSGIAGTGAMTFASGLTTFGQGSAFTLTGPLQLTGGSVRFLAGSAMTLPEDFVIQGTVLELSTGSAQSYGRTVALNAGGLGGSDPFDLTAGDLDWNGGTLFGPGVLTLRGNTRLLIDGPDDKTLEREVLVQDKAQWNSGNVIGGGLLHVADTGNFSVLTGGAFQANLLAQGRFDLFAPDQVAHFSGGFDAQAEVRLRAGTLRLSGNGESTAAFNVFSGGAVEFAGGTFDFHGRDASLIGPGRALFTGGTVVFRDGASYAMGSERITGGTLDFQAGSSYALNGGLVLEGGNLLLNAGSPFVLPPSTHLQSGLLGGGDAKHVNTGIVFLWSGGTIAGGGLAVLSGGRMEMIPGGAKVLETGIANAGVIAWRGSDVAGPGSFTNLAGGVFEISGSGTLFPSLANAGRLVMDGANENASLRGAFSNTGTVEVTAGTLHVLGPFSNLAGSTLTGGRYDLRGTLHHEGQSIRTIAADVTLAGAGSYLRSGTNQSVLDTLDTVAASGRFTVSEGRDFSMSNRSLTVDGEFVVGNGSTFVAQAFNLGGSGTVRVGDGGLFAWTGASLRGPGVVQSESGGVLRISGGNDHDMDQRRLVNDGTVVWEGGSIRGGGGSGIENNGLWLDQLAGNAEFNRAYGGANGGWVNNGTYRKTTGAITTFNQSLSNRNLIEVQAGVLRLSSSTVHETGSRIEVVDGALLELRADHTFQDGVHLDGPVKLYGGAGISGHLFATDFEIGSGSTLYGTHALHGDFRWTTGSLKSAGRPRSAATRRSRSLAETITTWISVGWSTTARSCGRVAPFAVAGDPASRTTVCGWTSWPAMRSSTGPMAVPMVAG
ncbi:MAG: hypothetical protein IPK20_13375 [Betaproteobacteria bacterium]|nr:hypothetical protein [Betaproteobacteria bacterium]